MVRLSDRLCIRLVDVVMAASYPFQTLPREDDGIMEAFEKEKTACR